MTNKKLWTPPPELIDNCQMTKFINEINRDLGLHIKTYHDLHRWSVENTEFFWLKILDFMNIIYKGDKSIVIDDLSKFPGAKWFPKITLNYSENLLKYNNPLFGRVTQKIYYKFNIDGIWYRDASREIDNGYGGIGLQAGTPIQGIRLTQ